MNLVNLEQASKAYGERPLLDRVSLGVTAGDRIGVVGRNGTGKTTLLGALAGTIDLDSGRSTRTRGITVGTLAQSQQLSGRVRDVVFGALPEHEWAADPRSRSVIGALLSDVDLDGELARLSGGERRRTMLAAVLRASDDLLLLDEPTNHLDIEAISWLAGYLREFGRSYVVVTHDRWFLDAVCERTWELADGQVHAYEGGYSAYVLARAERARLAEAADVRRRNLLRKELAWLRRGPPARTSKPKFRIAAATALIADEPPPRDGVELTRLAATRLGKTVIELEDVTVRAGQRTLLDDVTWQLGPGDRIGVVGVNGSGKTTLLRVMADALPLARAPEEHPAAIGLHAWGRMIRGSTVRLGYLTQEPVPVDPSLRVLEAAEQIRGSVQIGKGELSASQLLERLGLGGDRQWTPVGELSGGERRRLQLLLILLAEPNVLLLDEPTNDLDIETLTELEDLLDSWAGLGAGGQPRPLLPGADHRSRGRAGRRPGGLPARRRGRVPGAARRGGRAAGAAGQARGIRQALAVRRALGVRRALSNRRFRGARRRVGGAAAGGPEGTGPAGAPDQQADQHRGQPQRGAGPQRHRLRAAGRARRGAEGGPGGAGRAGGPLADPGRGTGRLSPDRRAQRSSASRNASAMMA